jgi:ribulose-phosphate 3-epimerase
MYCQFIPNITIGPLIVKAVHSVTNLPLDVHLMIENPERYITDFVKAEADCITVNIEACQHLHKTIQHIKEQGISRSCLNPHTPVEMIKNLIEDIDMVL